VNIQRFCFVCILASFGLIGWHYVWPIYRDVVSTLADWPFLAVNIIAFLCLSSGSWFIYEILGIADDEAKSRRIGDIKIDGELTEDFRLSKNYFSD